ncbi:MAG: HNH endonuclease family protein [Ancrocorticia sp.]
MSMLDGLMNMFPYIAAALSVVGAAGITPNLAILDEIPPTTENPPSEYQREEGFGRSWLDVDGNRCDTRNDILGLQLTDVEYVPMDQAPSRCRRATVYSGVLNDPYSGQRIEFTRDHPSVVQIDHLVPLSWAWRNGAWSWDQDKRIAFANDPENLLAVDGPTNQGKGDKGPSRWLPANEGFRCEYAVRFTGVVSSYGLSLPDDDRAALTSLLTDCASGDQSADSDEDLESIVWLVLLLVALWFARYLTSKYGKGPKGRRTGRSGKSSR